MDPMELQVAADFLEENGFGGEVIQFLRRGAARMRVVETDAIYEPEFVAIDHRGRRHAGNSPYYLVDHYIPPSQRRNHADDFGRQVRMRAIPTRRLRAIEEELDSYALTVTSKEHAEWQSH